MRNIQLKKDLYYIGAVDKNLRRFDIVMETKFGTTYNSYVLKGSEKIALIDGSKGLFAGDFMSQLQAIVPVEKIDYLVVQHTEPDHSGAICDLLDANPNITLVGSIMAMRLVKEVVNRDFKSIIVRDGDKISLGDKTLMFMPLPNLHWPDTMCTYVPELKVLFTCDFFGAHYATEEPLVSRQKNLKDYMDSRKYYFEAIMSPFKSYVRAGLTRLSQLDFDLVCVSHGPVIDTGLAELIMQYAQWAAPTVKGDVPMILIAYVSNYGYTKTLAETIEKTLRDLGLKVESYDLVETPKAKVLERVPYASGLLVGSPTIVGDVLLPVSEFLIELNPIIHGGIPASAFGSYGWSGEAVPNILARLKQVKMKVNDEGYRAVLKPNDVKLEGAKAFAEKFASQFNVKELQCRL